MNQRNLCRSTASAALRHRRRTWQKVDPSQCSTRHRGGRSRAPRVQRTAAVPRVAPSDCHNHRHHHPPTHGTRYVLHRDNTRNQHLGLPNRSPAHSRHAAPPRNYPEPQIHTLQSLKIDGGREPGGTEPKRTATATRADLTGHYLNSSLERRTVELQEKTAELEALCVAQYE